MIYYNNQIIVLDVYSKDLIDSMALSYNRLWKLLVDKKMSKAALRKAADM